jgi:hypothetical protein
MDRCHIAWGAVTHIRPDYPNKKGGKYEENMVPICMLEERYRIDGILEEIGGKLPLWRFEMVTRYNSMVFRLC